MEETHRLIETVTEPLAGYQEQHLAIGAILEDAFVEGHPAEAETMARLVDAGKRKHACLWHVLLWIVAVAALGGRAYPVPSRDPACGLLEFGIVVEWRKSANANGAGGA